MARPKNNNPEKEVVLAFFKSMASGVGFYNPHAKTFKEDIELEGLYQTNLSIVQDALKNGWTAKELEDLIFQGYNNGDRETLLSNVIPAKVQKNKIGESDNLLSDGEDYFHPMLYSRIAPRYSVYGNALFQMSAGSVEAKNVYTLKDLVDYYFSKVHIGNTPRTWVQAVGAFQYLLQDTSVDVILTAIDLSLERGLYTEVLKLQDYFEVAELEVSDRRARAETM